MIKKTKKIDTALIGCGYWGTNIARTLINLKKNIILVFLMKIIQIVKF